MSVETSIDCWDFDHPDGDDADPREHRCCPTCHGANLWDDDVRLLFTLNDGREAELCCGKIRKLVAMGLLGQEALTKAHPVGS